MDKESDFKAQKDVKEQLHATKRSFIEAFESELEKSIELIEQAKLEEEKRLEKLDKELDEAFEELDRKKRQLKKDREIFEKEKKEAERNRLRQQSIIDIIIINDETEYAFKVSKVVLQAIEGSFFDRMFSGRNDSMLERRDSAYILRDINHLYFENYILPFLRAKYYGYAEEGFKLLDLIKDEEKKNSVYVEFDRLSLIPHDMFEVEDS